MSTARVTPARKGIKADRRLKVVRPTPPLDGLTLDGLRVTRTVGHQSEAWRGAEIAKVLTALPEGMARDFFVGAGGISIEMLGLANVVLSLTEHDDLKDTHSASVLSYVSTALELLSHRVSALEPCGNRGPGYFRVERDS